MPKYKVTTSVLHTRTSQKTYLVEAKDEYDVLRIIRNGEVDPEDEDEQHDEDEHEDVIDVEEVLDADQPPTSKEQ